MFTFQIFDQNDNVVQSGSIIASSVKDAYNKLINLYGGQFNPQTHEYSVDY